MNGESPAAILRDLIAIPSESSGATATGPVPEAGIIDYIDSFCARHGLTIEWSEALSGRPNGLIRLAAPGRRRVLVTAHMDTVGAGGMEQPFSPVDAGGVIHGRGACDDKGSLAVLLSLLPELDGRSGTLPWDVSVAFTVDEERTMAGAAALARSHPRGWDLCLAMEPSGLRPITTHIGVYRCRLIPATGGGAACRRLGLGEPAWKTAQLFSGTATGWCIELPGWRYPVVCNVQRGQLQLDNYQGHWGAQQELDRLLQAYAVEKARLEARRQGYSVSERPLSDGSIQLTIHVGEA